MKEEWRDIPGYEGDYQVSNFGEVKSFKGKEKKLKLIAIRHGYLSVHLHKAGKAKLSKVHRLVAIAFIPNPKNKPEVNHKDGKKNNNRIDNLEWVTSSENQKHAFDVLHRKNSRWRGGVDIFSKNNIFLARVDDVKAAVEWIRTNSDSRYKVSKENINDVCRGVHYSAYGFVCKYVNKK